ncbi:AFG1/ZapE family ATPase [Psychromicrobium xiongbiense]|uniref:AFG1/ZapE family ATPase n=1 Tax=Psychromicrobium xiongbiense TaxID=3051184 RepID=UPI003B20ED13
MWSTRPPAPLPRPEELWATFAQLCESPTSTIEYLQWSRIYPRWMVTEVPTFDSADAQAHQRFINLIDVLVEVEADVSVSFVSGHSLATFRDSSSARREAVTVLCRGGRGTKGSFMSHPTSVAPSSYF